MEEPPPGAWQGVRVRRAGGGVAPVAMEAASSVTQGMAATPQGAAATGAGHLKVLARFEGFPSRKLETLRTAAALYAKLDAAVATLRGWKLAAPMSQQLDRVKVYFNKIKDDVDVIERNRDEEAKRFQSHSICFDLGVLVRIKEGMVELSSQPGANLGSKSRGAELKTD
ncbi:hypothetical protein ACP4OV_011414 [Aristida adscensionis]